MAVHSAGTGSGWLEDLDIDQPQGLDYREFNDFRIGVRKRLSQEHVTFADSTVGGIHKPGGSAVLGIDYTDDCTAGVAADGTYRGHGLVWAYSKDTSNYGVLFCCTKAAGATTTGDWTVIKMHPDLQWSGGDVTWAGAHEFDASVDISGNVAMDGDLTVDGAFALGGNAKIVGDCSVDSTFTVGGDAAFHADISIDGTADFGAAVAFGGDMSIDGTSVISNTILSGDVTFTFDAQAGEAGPIFKVFGDWSTRVNNTVYQARTDGFVIARSSGGNDPQIITDSNNPPGTPRASGYDGEDIMSPVKAGDYWCTTSANEAVYWLPLGDNT